MSQQTAKLKKEVTSNMGSPRTKVEVKGLEARHYDFFMNVLTLGLYPRFIRNAISGMELKPGESVLDFGCGTGRNDCLMRAHIGSSGRILGLDISDEMISQARDKCAPYPNVSFDFKRIEEPLPYENEFDVVFMSFVLHGFENDDKETIAKNAYRALKPGGRFVILDYNEFQVQQMFFPLRQAFVHGECPLALEFVEMDLKKFLKEFGFREFKEKYHFKKYVRLLMAYK
ncbi:MAG: class I SAM-dependent methyltransferase [Calditrichaeota bacterium]|nr:class I SAM-dependent methyltransferase [Calditrichota bacterium]